eukprot:5393697-Amphidinium_carterae.3
MAHVVPRHLLPKQLADLKQKGCHRQGGEQGSGRAAHLCSEFPWVRPQLRPILGQGQWASSVLRPQWYVRIRTHSCAWCELAPVTPHTHGPEPSHAANQHPLH